MKRSILLPILAAITMISCSKDEMTGSAEEDLGTPIRFCTAVETRMDQVGGLYDLPGFRVTATFADTGEVFFQDVLFKSERQGSLYYSPEKPIYWPRGYNLNFYAYGPCDAPNTAPFIPEYTYEGETAPGSYPLLTILNNDNLLLNYFLNSSISSPATDYFGSRQADLVAGVARNCYEGQQIFLPLQHLLSQVDIQAKSDNPVYQFKVYGCALMSKSYGFFNLDDLATTGYGPSTQATPASRDSWTFYELFPAPIETGGVYPVDQTGNRPSIPLTSQYQSILTTDATTQYGYSDEAIAVIPQLSEHAWDPEGNPENVQDGTHQTGTCLIVYVNISTKPAGGFYYPANLSCAPVAIPIELDLEPGKKYTYRLDFTNGAGYVYKNYSGDVGVDQGYTDVFPVGTPVMSGEIGLDVSVTDWPENSEDVPWNNQQ